MTGQAFDPGPAISYAAAGDWLAAYVEARSAHDGDAFVALFADDAEIRPDPFRPAVAGSNAIRAYLGQCAEVEAEVDLTVERHWVSAATILAPWHGSVVRLPDRARVKEVGFLAAEMSGGRCSRLRLWTVVNGGSAK